LLFYQRLLLLFLSLFLFPVQHTQVNESIVTVNEHTHITNNNKEVKICSFVEYVDTILCNSTDIYEKNNNNHIKESNNKIQNIKNEKSLIEFNLEMDPKNLCPLFELIDKSFCKSDKHIKVGVEKENIDPKDLCPLLELIETKLCS